MCLHFCPITINAGDWQPKERYQLKCHNGSMGSKTSDKHIFVICVYIQVYIIIYNIYVIICVCMQYTHDTILYKPDAYLPHNLHNHP